MLGKNSLNRYRLLQSELKKLCFFFSTKIIYKKSLYTYFRVLHPTTSSKELSSKADKNVIERIGQRKRSFKSNESIKGWHSSSLKVRINSDRLNEIKVPKSSNIVSYPSSPMHIYIFFFSFGKFFFSASRRGPTKTNYTNGLSRVAQSQQISYKIIRTGRM